MAGAARVTKPDFFIIGAPKCGTTSLVAWLSEHPDTFISDPKEPRYFNTDWSFPFRVADADAYADLFAGSRGCQAIGEATTGYLASETAVPAILEFQPEARFVVCLRPPVDLFFSLHGQRLKEGNETLRDPENAWNAQERRQRGSDLPYGVKDPKALNYDLICRLGTQMKRLFTWLPRNRVFVVLLEDLRDAPDDTFRSLCRFLEIEELSLPSYTATNTRRVPRFLWLQRVIRFSGIIRKKLGLPPLGLGTRVRNANLAGGREPDNTALRLRLGQHFADEIRRLEEAIDRDLSHWVAADRQPLLQDEESVS